MIDAKKIPVPVADSQLKLKTAADADDGFCSFYSCMKGKDKKQHENSEGIPQVCSSGKKFTVSKQNKNAEDKCNAKIIDVCDEIHEENFTSNVFPKDSEESCLKK